MTRRSRLPIALPALPVTLLAVLLTLSGCDGDAESDAPTPTTTVTVTQSPTESPTESPSESPTESATVQDGPAGPPTTYDEAVARIEAGKPPEAELGRFVTSTGIYCGLTAESAYAGCEVGDGTIEDPQVCADAPTRFVGRIELQGGAAVAVCNTDTIRTEGAPPLPDGSVATTRDTQCLSDETGVTCISRSGSGGFFLAPGRYELF